MSIPEVLAVLPPYTNKTNATTSRHARKKGSERTARIILEWLDNHPGTGWQEKWISSGSDTDLAWLDALTDPDDPRQEKGKRDEMKRGLVRLFLGRIVFPGYGFLSNYQATNLYSIARAAFRPDLFARFEERADALAANANQRKQAIVVATQIVLHTGRDLHELNSNDLLAYRAWHFLHRGSNPRTAHLAWSALVGIADLDGHQTLDMAIRHGQRKTEDLVDGYGMEQSAVREVLIRYLSERRPGTDYNSFASLVANVVGRFWSDIERHNPGLDTLDIPRDTAEAWKLRLSVIVNDAGETRPRRDYFSTLMAVRGMYRDIQEWATDDPTWAQWSFPSPVRRQDTRGYHKVRAQATAEIHQRIRERYRTCRC